MQGSQPNRTQPNRRQTERRNTITTQRKIRAGNSPGPCEVTSRVAHTHFLHSRLETWELLPLSRPLVTLTTSTSVQEIQNSPPPLDVEHFSARTSINRLCSSCIPSGPPTRRHSLLVGARTGVSYTDTTIAQMCQPPSVSPCARVLAYFQKHFQGC
jgi:hypothetical protein